MIFIFLVWMTEGRYSFESRRDNSPLNIIREFSKSFESYTKLRVYL